MSNPIKLRELERTARNVRERVDAGVPAAMHVTTDTVLALVAAVREGLWLMDHTDAREACPALSRFTDEEPSDA